MPQKLVGDVAVQDNGAHQGGVAFGVADRVEIATTTTGIILMSVHLQHQIEYNFVRKRDSQVFLPLTRYKQTDHLCSSTIDTRQSSIW